MLKENCVPAFVTEITAVKKYLCHRRRRRRRKKHQALECGVGLHFVLYLLSGGHLFGWEALWVGDGRGRQGKGSIQSFWWCFIWLHWPGFKEKTQKDKGKTMWCTHAGDVAPTQNKLLASNRPVLYWVAVIFGHDRAAGLGALGGRADWGFARGAAARGPPHHFLLYLLLQR